MNISPLADIISHWDDILASILEIRTQFMNAVKRKNPTLADLLQISYAISRLPLYLLRDKGTSGQSRVPALVGQIYKVNQGLLMALRKLATVFESESTTVSAEVFLEALQIKKWLIGQSEVCAGPPFLIEELAIALCEGTCHRDLNSDRIRLLVPNMNHFFFITSLAVNADLAMDALKLQADLALSHLKKILKNNVPLVAVLNDLDKDSEGRPKLKPKLQRNRLADAIRIFFNFERKKSPKIKKQDKQKIILELLELDMDPSMPSLRDRFKSKTILAGQPRLVDKLASCYFYWLAVEAKFLEFYTLVQSEIEMIDPSSLLEGEQTGHQIVDTVLPNNPRKYFKKLFE